MIEHLDIINALHLQIEALIDLMQCCGEYTDLQSIKVASEMCQTMLDELVTEVDKIEKEWKSEGDLLGEYAERLHSAISNRGSADLHDIINDVMYQLKEEL